MTSQLSDNFNFNISYIVGELNLQDWKMTDEVARVEIDGLENEQLLDCNEILRTYIF